MSSRRLLGAAGVLALLGAACSSSGDGGGADDAVRNITRPTLRTIAPQITVPGLVAAEPGGIVGAPVTPARRPLAEIAERFEVMAVPKATRWQGSARSQAVEMTRFVDAVPVVLRLPLPYDPADTARRVMNRTTGAKPATWPTGLAHQSDDPAVAEAATKVFDALTRLRGWATRAVDVVDLHTAYDAVFPRDGANKEVGSPIAAGTRFIAASRQVAQFTHGPFMRALLSVEEADALLQSGLVADITIDGLRYPTVDTSTTIIGSAELNTFGDVDGSGQAVVVLDTGVLTSHPAFAGRIVAEGCWVQDATCPGDTESSQAAGSGAACTFAPRCDHGTHVAGIAVGAAGLGLGAGVAPGADLVAYQAAGQSATTGQPVFNDSDLASALTAASNEAARRSIAAVNMSLGGGNFTQACPDAIEAVTAAISTLRAQNVAVIAATGNSSSTNGIGAPSCIDDAISVSAVDANDRVATYANMSAGLVDLMAPGGDTSTTGSIRAASTADDLATANVEGKQGTSMAAPHVAGAFALLRQMYPEVSVASLLRELQSTGVSVTDRRSGGGATSVRIDLARFVDAPTATSLTSTTTYSGNRWTLSAGSGATAASPTEWRATVDLSPGTVRGIRRADVDQYIAYVTVRNGQVTGINWGGGVVRNRMRPIGVSQTPCRAIGPARAYRADPLLGIGIQLGPNPIRIFVTQGTVVEGVSLVLISKPIGRSTSGAAVILSEGLAVLNGANPRITAPLGARVTLDSKPVSLHVGMADGQAARESPLVLTTSRRAGGTAVSPADDFAGGRSGLWNNNVYDLSRVGLVGSPIELSIGHAGINGTREQRDCLSMAYALLNIGGLPVAVGKS